MEKKIRFKELIFLYERYKQNLYSFVFLELKKQEVCSHRRNLDLLPPLDELLLSRLQAGPDVVQLLGGGLLLPLDYGRLIE